MLGAGQLRVYFRWSAGCNRRGCTRCNRRRHGLAQGRRKSCRKWVLGNWHHCELHIGCEQAAVDAGAPAVIVSAISAHKDVAKIVEYGCRALINITYCSGYSYAGGKKAAVDAGAPAAIVAAMAAHKDVAEIAGNGCLALANIAHYFGGEQAAVDAGATAAIVAAMAAHKDVADVAENGCRALGSITETPAGQQAAVNAGATRSNRCRKGRA